MSTPSARSNNKNDPSLEEHHLRSESSVLIPKYNTNNANKVQVFKWCRMTGVLYALIIICGIYADVGVCGRFISFSSATETAKNIESHALQFRSTILFEIVMCISDVCVAVLLSAIFFYCNNHSGEGSGSIDKFHHVNENITIVLMALFRLIQTAIIACNLLHSFAASLILDPSFTTVTAAGIGLQSITSDENESDGEGGLPLLAENLALLFLSIQKYGYTLALVFFGISLALLGIMIKRESNTLIRFPKMLGLSCILAGIGYIWMLSCTLHGQAMMDK
ncbi:hypothetical protein CTEN210_00394 [Chaetoceros tenuissimus]|uniref:Uncharacterized protein n=1 Tax=Chaetoceros tenuissimus TaxID=426638 RepID=A0AAD3CFY7_9STRA|nr:hypothetical protein CTEN210_00394 [Chaetoceros tenuissimus]